ncbi:MAG TPA: metalloregulator ArsR/SmtB family transcription factor [Bacteroidales bacterium]|nr:metalloregulator ArsR/SmtB family transcription factor [Bacteroidales bacterium]HQK37899.1 metalloregulator ArsR/SmtB family transcription factor [Bacteroidales bacterium]
MDSNQASFPFKVDEAKGFTVEQFTSEQLDRAAVMLKAMAHPARISILNLLNEGKKLTVTEIHEMLHMEQSVASHHLGILRDKGILSSKREGKNTFYFIKNPGFLGIIECINRCACL